MSSPRKRIFCIGANHTTVGIERREQLFIDAEAVRGNVDAVRQEFGLDELGILATCNRLEVFGVHSEGSDHHLLQCFRKVYELNPKAPKLADSEVQNIVYIYSDHAAIDHVLRVASSLDSMIVGETQITGQFKDCIALAEAAGTIGPILKRLSNEALATSKKVRTKTAISRKPVSVGHAAVDMAKLVFGNISKHEVAVIGAGEMARIAAEYLKGHNPRALHIVNRSGGRAAELVRHIGSAQAHTLDDLPDLLRRVDIVIAATSAGEPLVKYETVRSAMVYHQQKPLVLIDIAIPRNIEPRCNQLEDVYVFDIDDLKQTVEDNVKEREAEAQRAQSIVDEGCQHFEDWLKTLDISPSLNAFRNYLDSLIEREWEKTRAKGILMDLSDEQTEAITKLLRSIADKMSGDASSQVRNPTGELSSIHLANALHALFGQRGRKH